MKTFISFSGGVESTTMCIMYGNGATAIVADTGDEEDIMYARWNYVKHKVQEIHNGNFDMIFLKGSVKIKDLVVHNLNDAAMRWKYFPSKMNRYCTRIFKIEPIDKYLSQQGECELMIGLNADEENDRVGNYMECKNVKYTYPLVEDGLTRKDCIDILDMYDLNPDFPPFMARGGCKKCFFKSKNEIKAKYFFDRDGFIKDMEYENQIQDKKKKFYGINMNFPAGYKSVMDECEMEIAMFGYDEIKSQYTKISSHSPCGVFCHR